MAFSYPGNLNTYVPMAVEALQTNFSQNPSLFSINQYVTVAPVPNMTGYYDYHDPREETRIDLSNMSDQIWADGAFPQVNFAKGNQFVQFTTTRYHQMFSIGDLAAQQATWNVITDHSNSAAMRLMTIRTYNVLNALTTTGNWGSNTDTATSLGGGYWSAGTSTTLYIMKSLQAAIVAIQKSTNATVGPRDLCLVVSPAVAYAMAASAEIVDLFKQSYVAQQFVERTPASGFFWGIPDPLYGVRVIVEDRVYNSAAHGSTADNDYILGKNAFLVARPGTLTGALNTMSTATLAMFQDMNMILRHNDLALLTEGVLYDNYATIVRPESGYLITAVIA